MAGYNKNAPGLRELPDDGWQLGPSVSAVRLWSGGVAALAGLVGVLVVRAVLRITLFAPAAQACSLTLGPRVSALSRSSRPLLSPGWSTCLVFTPRPLAYFGSFVGLVTAAAGVAPFLSGGSAAVMLALVVIHLVIGLAVGSLISGAAVGATADTTPTH